jgi:cell division protein FtsL
MTDTPRTDEAFGRAITAIPMQVSARVLIVVDRSRRIERELTAAQAKADEWKRLALENRDVAQRLAVKCKEVATFIRLHMCGRDGQKQPCRELYDMLEAALAAFEKEGAK